MIEIDRISDVVPGSIRRFERAEPVAGTPGTRARSSGAPEDARAASPGQNESAAGADNTTSAQGRRLTDVSPETVREEVQSRLNELLEEVMGDGFPARELRVSRDEESARFVYTSVDIESGEVIRQFPPEEILRLVRAVREAAGLVHDETA